MATDKSFMMMVVACEGFVQALVFVVIIFVILVLFFFFLLSITLPVWIDSSLYTVGRELFFVVVVFFVFFRARLIHRLDIRDGG